MIGAIIGDIAGSVYEFNNTLDYDFDMFGPGADYTDDTILTIAVADAIIKGEDFAQALRRWGRRYPNPKGAYGATFGRWLLVPGAGPYNSYGNGAAMRVSPCGFAGRNRAEAIRLAIESARVSHDHTEALVGVSCVAECIALCYENNYRDALWKRRAIEDVGERYYGRGVTLPGRGVWNETCQGCVPLAVLIVSRSAGFEDAIRQAVSYGGDSDTLAAIVGGMAEAVYGVPEELRVKALGYLPEDMKKVITKFYKNYGK